MKRLLSGLLALALLLLGSGWCLLSAGRRLAPPNHFMATLRDKMAAVAHAGGPRLLLVGGSNLTFGVDSAELQRLVGRPVLNTSLHAGLGLDFPLWLIGRHLRPGDTVLVVPEYLVYAPNPEVLAQAMLFYPEGMAYVEERFPAADRFRFWLLSVQKALSALHIRAYLELGGTNPDRMDRRDFSPHGDMLAHLERAPLRPLKDVQLRPADYSPARQMLEDFVQLARSRQAQVLYAYPVAAHSFVSANRQAIRAQEEQLQGLSCPVINNPESAALPDELFYDTVYHPLRRGRELRTRILARAVKPYLPGP